MKNLLLILVVLYGSTHAYASASNGFSSAAKKYSEILQAEADADYQQKLELQRMERQHQLDMQKIEQQRRDRIDEESRNRSPTSSEKLDRESNAKLIEQAHPGWVSIVRGERFQQWKKQQPKSVQALGDSTNPSDAILMLDIFKRDQK